MNVFNAKLALRLSATVAHVLLIGWFINWQLWLSPPRLVTPEFLLTIILVPLLPLLPGLALGWPRAAGVWTPLMIMPYFAWAMTETIANPEERLWAATATALSMAVFTLCVLFAGLHRRKNRT